MTETKKHYIYKLATNIIRIPVSFALQAIFPRVLAPSAYGNFDFLTDSAMRFIGFFESGSSIAFYTKLSSDTKDTKFVKAYWWLVVLISLIYLLFVLSAGVFSFYDVVWPQQNFFIVFLSTVWGIITYFSNTSFRMLDAYYMTVKAEKFRMIQLVASVVIFIPFLFLNTEILLNHFFFIQIGLLAFLFIGSWRILFTSGYSLYPKVPLEKKDIYHYGNYFWKFSSPLMLYALVGLVAAVGDRWILQKFGGSVQQAYFGISIKAGALVFIFTNAMMPLLMREFSKLFGANEVGAIKNVFTRNFRVLMFLASFIAVFMSSNAEFILSVLGGNKYGAAVTLVSMMAFYPVHQTLGQLNGTLFYTTMRTKEYTRVAIMLIPVGLVLSFFFMAPHEYHGLSLGAFGLACQMLFTQVLIQNVLLFINCRFLNISFWQLLGYQVVVLGCLSCFGFASDRLAGFVHVNIFGKAMIAFALYSLATCCMLLLRPSLAGFQNLQEMLAFPRIFFRRKRH